MTQVVTIRSRQAPPHSPAAKAKAKTNGHASTETHKRMLEHLKASGLTERDGYFHASDSGPNKFVKSPGYYIYYPSLEDGKQTDFWRFRYFDPSGKAKYLQPDGTAPRAYFSQNVNWTDYLGDSRKSLVVVEGEKKCLAACKRGIVCIGIGGVDAFKRKGSKDLLPEMAGFVWAGRRLYAVYDSDAATNQEVKNAIDRLARKFTQCGADVFPVILPEIKGKKTGLDDYLLHHSNDDLLGLFAKAVKWEVASLLTQEDKDVGNGDRLLEYGEANFLYVAAFKRWAVYDGRRWPVNDREQEHIRTQAHACIREFGVQAAKQGHKEKIRFAAESLNSSRITNMMREAQPNATIKIEQLDANPWLINFRNGTLTPAPWSYARMTVKTLLRPRSRTTMTPTLSGEMDKLIGPKLAQLRTSYGGLADKRGEVREALSILRTIQDIEARRTKLDANPDGQPGSAVADGDLSTMVAEEFAVQVETVLKAWNFPGAERVHFDAKSRDLIIAGKARGARGKGLRAITHAGFTIGLLDYCKVKDTPHPGFVILDSPLLAYRAPEGKEDDLRGTDLDERFYDYLAGLPEDRQVIIVENVDPPAAIKARPQVIMFSGNPHTGRYGFFPLISNEKAT